jgi:hypothetical protein
MHESVHEREFHGLTKKRDRCSFLLSPSGRCLVNSAPLINVDIAAHKTAVVPSDTVKYNALHGC